MDALQIFATGGASGLIGLALFLLFKFLQSRHHLVSQCTKDGVNIVADASTPNIIPPIVDAKNNVCQAKGLPRQGERSDDSSTIQQPREDSRENVESGSDGAGGKRCSLCSGGHTNAAGASESKTGEDAAGQKEPQGDGISGGSNPSTSGGGQP